MKKLVNELDGLTIVIDELSKFEKKLQEKIDKEQTRCDKKFIVFKSFECHTHDEIDDVYRYDYCTLSECEKAHDRLDEKLKGNSDKLNKLNIAKKIIDNMIYNSQCERMDLRKKIEIENGKS